jgi:hypothetical protein
MRNRGQGSVFQKKGTRCWTIQYYDPKTGKPVQESTGTRNRPEAVAILNQRLVAIGRGEPVPETNKLALADLFAMVENDYIADGKRSLKRIRQAMNHLRSFFGDDCKVKTITTDRITAYVAHRRGEKHRQGNGAGNGTINRELTALRRAMSLAADAGKLTAIPKIKKLQEPPARSGFFERSELEAICEELPQRTRRSCGSRTSSAGGRVNY